MKFLLICLGVFVAQLVICLWAGASFQFAFAVAACVAFALAFLVRVSGGED